MTDTFGYTHIVFGLFHLLGYQFSHRLADPATPFWCKYRTADYGALNGIARQPPEHRPDRQLLGRLLRVAGSLSTGTVRASEILRVLRGSGRLTPTGRRRRTQPDHQDDLPARLPRRRALPAAHSHPAQPHRSPLRLARQVLHGQRGQRCREGQEDQLGALGLVLNAIVLWNTRYLDAALTQLRSAGHPAYDADVERLSPLVYDHINLLGRYHFTDPVSLGNELRPLRDPRTAED